jgi:hypothetical protein
MKFVYGGRLLKVLFAAILAGCAGAVLIPVALIAGVISFEVPVDCRIGQDCFIQNYFDHDPGPDRKDYACGRLSYDSHPGTDFRVLNLPAMENGVAVLAAAPGVVKGIRNDMPDISIKQIGAGQIKGREAGNGVVIDHGDGWVSQYSHLKQGSVVVKQGQTVKTGEKIGLIGLSGNTEFPHVEFTLRYRDKPVDPFVGTNGWSGCANTEKTLWSENVLMKMRYIPTGALTAGFSPAEPNAQKAREGAYHSFPADPKMMVLWVDLFGVENGDRQEFRIIGPHDKPMVTQSQILDKSNVSWFAYAGCRQPVDGWPKGVYKGLYSLIRKDKVIISISIQIEI